MVNIIWMLLTLIGIVFAVVNDKMDEVNKAIFQGASEAVTISIGLISVLVFWLGMMSIAQQAGILDKLAALFRPIVARLFPDIPKDHPAIGYILSNMIANMFGLGNAATPLGLKAMEQLQKLNGDSDEASRSMITFLAINTSSLTLIPTTVIAIRITYESANPAEIIGTTLLATICSAIGAVLLDRYFYYRRAGKGGRR
ncbi:nucleoside recognition domain-containing protein [Priestia abyssalis]|uniref:nucleoside recognition domain-containing protein n=1 Tax=Priestia abyssalis TaxID=1221450 RepID=UPI000424D06A|nr:nucleoside recognition domain-containing protein [Priestia abyssalis]MDQ0244294.1 spore maturation protein A [Bacillus fengqiuensis]